MKTFHLKSSLFWLFCLYLTMVSAKPATQLKINRTPTSDLSLNWNSVTGLVYRTYVSGQGTTNWSKFEAHSVATSTVSRLNISPSASSAYYKVAESPLEGSFLYKPSNTVSGVIQIPIFTSRTTTNRIQSIALLERRGMDVNVLDIIDSRAPANRVFPLDTARLRNGTNHLELEIVDRKGPLTSEDPQVSNSETLTLVVSNKISVLSDPETEFRWYIRFATPFQFGSWDLFIDDHSGTPSIMSGELPGDGSEIEISDPNVGNNFAHSYNTPYLDFQLSVFENYATEHVYSFRSRVVSAPPKYEVCILNQDSYALTGPRFVQMMQTVLDTSTVVPNHFDINTLTRDPFPETWNNIVSPTHWQVCNDYLNGQYVRRPSHLYYFGYVGSDWLGQFQPNSDEGVSLATLEENPPHYLSFVILDGGNIPLTLVKRLIGTTRNMSLAQSIREGKRPHFAITWSGRRFSELVYDNDLDLRQAQFMTKLHELAWELDVLLYTTKRMSSVLSQLQAQYPDIMPYLRVYGCSEMYADQLIHE